MSDDLSTSALEAEVRELQARVSELEALLADQARTTNAIVARSQEKLYWLERWQIDLDAIMRKPGATQLMDGVKAMRFLVRLVRMGKRRLLG